MLRYRVAHMFAVDGVLMTNDHQAEIRALPRAVRDEQIALGNLVEWDDRQGVEAPAAAEAAAAEAAAAPTTTTKKGR